MLAFTCTSAAGCLNACVHAGHLTVFRAPPPSLPPSLPLASLSGSFAEGVQLQKNFPPCYPIARNHIKAEVPSKYQLTVRLGFLTYLSALSALTQVARKTPVACR
jgi:hypothetical protein